MVPDAVAPITQSRARRLCDLCPGQQCILRSIHASASPAVVARLRALGLTDGSAITVAYRAPLRDPVAYQFCDTTICLRRAQAALLEVEVVDAQQIENVEVHP